MLLKKVLNHKLRYGRDLRQFSGEVDPGLCGPCGPRHFEIPRACLAHLLAENVQRPAMVVRHLAVLKLRLVYGFPDHGGAATDLALAGVLVFAVDVVNVLDDVVNLGNKVGHFAHSFSGVSVIIAMIDGKFSPEYPAACRNASFSGSPSTPALNQPLMMVALKLRSGPRQVCTITSAMNGTSLNPPFLSMVSVSTPRSTPSFILSTHLFPAW